MSGGNRYGTAVEDGIIYVASPEGRLEVGPVDAAIDAVGGPSWTITYTEAEKRRYPEMETADEGLTVDVVDMMYAVTFSERFVETMAAHPAETPEDDTLSPRMGLFVGKLLENLDGGVD